MNNITVSLAIVTLLAKLGWVYQSEGGGSVWFAHADMPYLKVEAFTMGNFLRIRHERDEDPSDILTIGQAVRKLQAWAAYEAKEKTAELQLPTDWQWDADLNDHVRTIG